MRPIHAVRLDKVRPAVILTREVVLPHVSRWTVAPVTTRVRGLSTEVAVGPRNGLDHDGVVNCDNVVTVHVDDVGRLLGYLLPDQEARLRAAVVAAFDLEA